MKGLSAPVQVNEAISLSLSVLLLPITTAYWQYILRLLETFLLPLVCSEE